MTDERNWAKRLYAHQIALDLDAGRMTLEQALERLRTRLERAKHKQADFPEFVRQAEWDIEAVNRARLLVDR